MLNMSLVVFLFLVSCSCLLVHGQKHHESLPKTTRMITTSGGLKIHSSAFISPVSPSIASSHHSPAPWDIRRLRTLAIASEYKVTSTQFFSTKESSSSTPTTKSGKIQVKLLKDIPGIGQAGDFIQTAPAYFENKLRPSKSAIRVSSEEMAHELAQRKLQEKEKLDHAIQMKEKVQSLVLEMKMKSGPDGHLFGGVGYKHIMEEVKKKFPSGALDGKHVKITSIVTEEGNKDTGHDIKHVGNYKVTLLLMKDVSADFSIHISSLM